MPQLIERTEQTMFQSFNARWKEGCGSSLCPGAKKCLVRGEIPCDVLFVGEAPSVGANVIGLPFVGECGVVLDDFIKRAGANGAKQAFTNLVGCIPRSNDGGHKAVRKPPDEAIAACQPRLREFIALCNPKLIIAVGRVAEIGLSIMQSQGMFAASIPIVYMVHPSHVLQTKCNGPLAWEAIETLKRAIAEHVTNSSGQRQAR